MPTSCWSRCGWSWVDISRIGGRVRLLCSRLAGLPAKHRFSRPLCCLPLVMYPQPLQANARGSQLEAEADALRPDAARAVALENDNFDLSQKLTELQAALVAAQAGEAAARKAQQQQEQKAAEVGEMVKVELCGGLMLQQSKLVGCLPSSQRQCTTQPPTVTHCLSPPFWLQREADLRASLNAANKEIRALRAKTERADKKASASMHADAAVEVEVLGWVGAACLAACCCGPRASSRPSAIIIPLHLCSSSLQLASKEAMLLEVQAEIDATRRDKKRQELAAVVALSVLMVAGGAAVAIGRKLA